METVIIKDSREEMKFRKLKNRKLIDFYAYNCPLFDDNEGWDTSCLAEWDEENQVRKSCDPDDCPLCDIANMEALKKFNKHIYEEWKNDLIGRGISPKDFNDINLSDYGCDWAILHSEAI